MMNKNYSPGMRIVVRDAEWVIRRSDLTPDDGHLIECEGISELVRGKEGRFLTAIENNLKYSQADAFVMISRVTSITLRALFYKDWD